MFLECFVFLGLQVCLTELWKSGKQQWPQHHNVADERHEVQAECSHRSETILLKLSPLLLAVRAQGS